MIIRCWGEERKGKKKKMLLDKQCKEKKNRCLRKTERNKNKVNGN